MLSHRTEGLLIEALHSFSHGELGTLLRRVGLAQFDPGAKSGKQWINKDQRLQAVFDQARSADDEGVPPFGQPRSKSEDAQRGVLDLVVELLDRQASDPDAPPQWLPELRERLLADGYELHADVEDIDVGWPHRRKAHYRLLPAGATVAPIAPEISALEVELTDRGFEVARTHYAQAVSNYTDGQLETANGALRSFLESLFVKLASRYAGYQGSEPIAALQQLQNKRVLLGGEFNLLRGLWDLSQDNGAHAGLTTAAEALFRMQTTTSSARFLLHHLPK